MAKRVQPSNPISRPSENIFLGTKTLRQDREALTKYLAVGSESLPLKDRMEATLQLAMCENLLGNVTGWNEAQRLLQICEEYIMAYGRDKEKGCVFQIRATEHILKAEYAEGLAASIKALHLFQREAMPFYTMDTAIRCGINCFLLNMIEEGREYLTQAETLAVQLGDERAVIACLSNIEDNRVTHESPENGIHRNELLHARIKKEYKDEPIFLMVNIFLRFSNYYIAIGDVDKGGEYADKGLSLILSFPDMPNYVTVFCFLHLVKLRQAILKGDEPAMLSHSDKALQLAEKSQTIYVRVQVYSSQCRFYLKKGDMLKAKNSLAKLDVALPAGDRSKLYLDKLEVHCEYHKAVGETSEELAYFQLIHDYKMKVQQEAIANRMKYMTTVYELELSRQELARRKQELDHKTEELNMAAYHLQQRNDLLTDLKENLEQQQKSNSKVEPALAKISKTIARAFVKEEEEKERIREKFDEAHHAFIARLHQAYPDLSPTECRLCALLKSGFNTKEISNLLSTSIRNVENHRTRIRKKLNLKKEDNLNLKLTEIG